MIFRDALPFITLFCFMIAYPAYPQDKPDPKQMKLLYSANDKLCAPLAKVYDQLSHEHGRGGHLILNWEDQFSGRFQKVGLTKPHSVDGPEPEQFGPSDLRTYYQLDLSPQDHNRILYIDDQCVGRCDEFSTTIWVFNPQSKPALKEYEKGPDAGGQYHKWMLFDPDTVESEISFSFQPKVLPQKGEVDPFYPNVYGRFFDKITNEQEKSLSFKERLDRYEPYIVGGSGPFIQRVWLFQGDAIFTAREFGIGVLVYKYSGPNSIEDLCYIVAQEAIAAQQRQAKQLP